MLEELKECEKAGLPTACVMQIYVYIDTMSYLGMPITKETNTKNDFITWVNDYLKADERQPYQYRGADVYGARCSLLHTFSSEAEFHTKYPDTIKFVYHDGGRHMYNPSIDATLVIIGISSLVNDFIIGVQNFMRDIQIRIKDDNQKDILNSRINKIFNTIPFPSTQEKKLPRFTFSFNRWSKKFP